MPANFAHEQSLVFDTVEKIYTGHCTGEKPFAILKEELEERIDQLRVGAVMEF